MSPLDKQFPSGPWKVIIRHRDAHVANNKTLKKAKITPRCHRAKKLSSCSGSVSSPSPRYRFHLFEISTVKICTSICSQESTIQNPFEYRTNDYS